MKIRIEIQIGPIVVANEYSMPDSQLAQAIGPSALLDQVHAGLWKKMSVAVDKALEKMVVNHESRRFDVA